MASTISIKLTGVSKYYHDFPALQDISLNISEGERVGIIGANGAGKTTLLSIIAGFSSASGGNVQVQGKVSAIMDLGVGIREELTGVENIYVSGELNGKSRAEVSRLLPDMIEFADIGEYINKPVKTYSSGMKARLSFALLAFVDPEILVIDEVLGVGDAFFVNKSTRRLQELCAKGKILLVVSHSMDSIRQLTDRCLWLSEGRLIMDGDSLSVCQAYLDSVREKEEIELQKRFQQRMASRQRQGQVKITALYLRNDQQLKKNIFQVRERLTLILEIEALEALANWDVRLFLHKMDGTLLLCQRATEDGAALPALNPAKRLCLEVDFGELRFADDVYELVVEILSSSEEVIASQSRMIKIENASEFYSSKPDFFCDYSIRG